jgi:hypothetical protein
MKKILLLLSVLLFVSCRNMATDSGSSSTETDDTANSTTDNSTDDSSTSTDSDTSSDSDSDSITIDKASFIVGVSGSTYLSASTMLSLSKSVITTDSVDTLITKCLAYINNYCCDNTAVDYSANTIDQPYANSSWQNWGKWEISTAGSSGTTYEQYRMLLCKVTTDSNDEVVVDVVTCELVSPTRVEYETGIFKTYMKQQNEETEDAYILFIDGYYPYLIRTVTVEDTRTDYEKYSIYIVAADGTILYEEHCSEQYYDWPSAAAYFAHRLDMLILGLGSYPEGTYVISGRIYTPS